ncbi:MAG: hypothetical protein OEV95_06880, partial [Gemmatimonadota bacterium]|nr:hypothetical protein [Gemmatimonadota bacterium]
MTSSMLRVVALAGLLVAHAASAQDVGQVNAPVDSVSVRFIDTDLRAVVQALSPYLSKPVMTAGLPAVRVTLETPSPVPRASIPTLLRGLMEIQGLTFEESDAFYRLGPSDRPSVGPTESPPIQLFVIRLKHARASDVAATINLLFGGSGAFAGGESGLGTGTLSDELRRQRVPAVNGPPDRRPDGPSDHPATLSSAVTIVPDELTNALLIRATPEDIEVLRGAIDQLDVRPLQVLIEVLIVEARKSKHFSLGTSLFLPPTAIPSDPNGNATVGGATQGAGVGDLVLELLKLGKPDIDATLSASASRGNVRIVSRPVLLTANNTEASFLVGSQRPFVQVSRLLPTDNNNQDRVVQYRDVGTRLRVRPNINQDGYVSLRIQQEINQATAEVAYDAPVIATREAVTQVLVRDGQTILLGGLTDS